MAADVYDSTHAYDTAVAYDDQWAAITQTFNGLTAGQVAFVEVRCLPAVVKLASGYFVPDNYVFVPALTGYTLNLAVNSAFSDLSQYYLIQEVYFDGHRLTYKVRVPSPSAAALTAVLI